jgi:hypothetical protein
MRKATAKSVKRLTRKTATNKGRATSGRKAGSSRKTRSR